MGLVAEGQLITAMDELAVGDSIYLEKTGQTYWVESLSRKQVVLSDVDGRTNTWVPETLEAAFAVDTWVHQGRPPARIEDLEEP